jgi:hypothetical protein
VKAIALNEEKVILCGLRSTSIGFHAKTQKAGIGIWQLIFTDGNGTIDW